MKISNWLKTRLRLVVLAFVGVGLTLYGIVACQDIQTPYESTQVMEDAVVQDGKFPTEYISLALKKLSKTDCGKSKSTMRELYGVKEFVVVLGDVKESKKFKAKYYYISDSGIETFNHMSTWYSPRRNPNAKTVNNEKRLYYGTDNKVMKLAQPGDLLLLIRLDNSNIEIRVFDKHYSKLKSNLSRYDMHVNNQRTLPAPITDKSQLSNLINDQDIELASEEHTTFDIPKDFYKVKDFQLWRNKHNKRKWVIGNVSKIADGDTWHIDDIIVIRPVGMDSAERKQTCLDENNKEYACGLEATERVKKIIGNGLVSCELIKYGKWGRSLAVCYNSKGVEINRQMVKEGYAVVSTYPPYTYTEEESYAINQKIGLWRGKFQHPHCYRHQKKQDWTVDGLCENNKYYHGWSLFKQSIK